MSKLANIIDWYTDEGADTPRDHMVLNLAGRR